MKYHEMMQMAMSETVVRGSCGWHEVNKARLLLNFKTNGAEHMVICAACYPPSRPDLWGQCAKVRVIDALLNRHCSVASKVA